MHLVGCLYYLYQWCTVKQISDNEMYLLIKYIKSVLWRVAKRLSYIEKARCLKVNNSVHGLGWAGIATRHGLDGPGIESRWGRYFPHFSRPALGLTPPPIKYGYRVFPEGKATGAWPWPPTPSSTEVKERVELYLYSPSGPSWPVLGWPLPLPFYTGWMIRVQISSGARDFSLSTANRPDLLWSPAILLFSEYRKLFPRG